MNTAVAGEAVGVEIMAIGSRALSRLTVSVACLALWGVPARATVDEAAYGRVDLAAVEQDLDLGSLRKAIDLYRRGDIAGGDQIRSGIASRAARAMTEWIAIRSGAALGFDRILEFSREHPAWAGSAFVRRRAEEALFYGRKPAATVRAFFAAQRPTTPAGKLALALAFRAEGFDRDAAGLVRDAYREDTFGAEFEAKLLDLFPGVLGEADHRFRMERLLFKESWEAAGRAAARAGKDHPALVKARRAVADQSSKAGAALDSVPPALRGDTSYVFSRVQHLRRKDQPVEAAKLLADITRDPAVLVDGDEWWTERRLVARKLLDGGNPGLAYEVVRDHGAESNQQRIEAEFHAGWIALRFLGDAATATGHFASAARTAETPISMARCAYWQGRAAEAAGLSDEARAHFERAGQQPITYYGQLARAKLGLGDLPLRGAPAEASAEEPEGRTVAEAARLLYRAGTPELALPLLADWGQRARDPAHLKALGSVALENRDARGLLTLGKAGVQRGFPLDLHAFPTEGIPAYEPVGDRVETAMVYAIARQESAFDPRAQSGVGARGLMQLMPATAKRTAQRYKVGFDLDRLVDDPSYNAKLGSAHLGELMQDWKGSYILAFASYNAGGGNVKKWIDAYGDPRKPEVDPVDWVERIPFSETRNYVQRVMENLQVYRSRLGGGGTLAIEADMRRGAATSAVRWSGPATP